MVYRWNMLLSIKELGMNQFIHALQMSVFKDAVI